MTLPERPRQVSDRYPAATGPVAEAAAKSAELLIRIAGLDLKPQVFQGEERLEVDLSGADVIKPRVPTPAFRLGPVGNIRYVRRGS